jgi:septal ring factor EnvC (AmiA/AmiB activator)
MSSRTPRTEERRRMDKFRMIITPAALVMFMAGLIISLISVLHARDIEAINNNTSKLEVVDDKVYHNCRRIAVLENAMKNLEKTVERIKENQESQHDMTKETKKMTEEILDRVKNGNHKGG